MPVCPRHCRRYLLLRPMSCRGVCITKFRRFFRSGIRSFGNSLKLGRYSWMAPEMITPGLQMLRWELGSHRALQLGPGLWLLIAFGAVRPRADFSDQAGGL